jgi:hypothetical protein
MNDDEHESRYWEIPPGIGPIRDDVSTHDRLRSLCGRSVRRLEIVATSILFAIFLAFIFLPVLILGWLYGDSPRPKRAYRL